MKFIKFSTYWRKLVFTSYSVLILTIQLHPIKNEAFINGSQYITITTYINLNHNLYTYNIYTKKKYIAAERTEGTKGTEDWGDWGEFIANIIANIAIILREYKRIFSGVIAQFFAIYSYTWKPYFFNPILSRNRVILTRNRVI